MLKAGIAYILVGVAGLFAMISGAAAIIALFANGKILGWW
jgi:uncharacterized membrane protein YuzA (DUF378 family)